MPPSTNTQFGPTASIKTLDVIPSTLSYLMKSELDNTAKAINNNVNALFDKLLDKYYKVDAKLDKEYVIL